MKQRTISDELETPMESRASGGFDAADSNWNSQCSMRRSAARWLFALLFLAAIGLHSARAQVTREYQLKAVFLFNFAQFTEWPTNTFASTNEPFVIGILGSDPFGPAMDDTVRGETAHGHKIVVERYRTVKDVKTCHILFISQSETRRLEQTVTEMRNKPVLTVSDIEDAAFRGVVIGFFTDRNRIRFSVNVPAAKSAGLTLSSKLLRAAELMPREDER